MNRICRVCKHPIQRDEGCFEVPPHHDPDGPEPGFYCLAELELRPGNELPRLVIP